MNEQKNSRIMAVSRKYEIVEKTALLTMKPILESLNTTINAYPAYIKELLDYIDFLEGDVALLEELAAIPDEERLRNL